MYEVLFPGLLNTHTYAHTEKKKNTKILSIRVSGNKVLG